MGELADEWQALRDWRKQKKDARRAAAANSIARVGETGTSLVQLSPYHWRVADCID